MSRSSWENAPIRQVSVQIYMGKHANTQYNGKCLSRATLVNTQIHGEGAKLLENTQVVLVFGAERLGVGGRRAGVVEHN